MGIESRRRPGEQPSGPADLIEVRGIRAVGKIGVLPEEQARAQPFEIDLTVATDVAEAAARDDLACTVNYAEMAAAAVQIVENEGSALLERTAARIAETVLAMARVDAVEVTIRKLRPPIPEDVATTGVTIHRQSQSEVAAVTGQPTRKPTKAYVALGSNLGDRRDHLRFALAQLPDVVNTSGLYETDPVGGPDQGPYLNMVVELVTHKNPFELLDICLSIETGAGRERTVRWGERTLDLDLLLWGDAKIETPFLVIPHPRMWQRRFVLTPLGDLAPELLPADWAETVEPGEVTRVADLA